MKKILFTLFLVSVFLSCEKYPDPANETLEYFYFRIIGGNQSGVAGEYLDQEVGVFIDQGAVTLPAGKQFQLEIEVTQGGGSVDQNLIDIHTNGEMITKWKLGTESNIQILTCRILASDKEIYPEFTISATAYFTNSLNTLSSGYLVGIQDMVSDTLNQRSMMYNQGQMWVTTDEFYTWQAKGFPFSTSVRMMDMSSDGIVFAAGWDGALYKTEDWGESWDYICNPIPESSTYYNFNITRDDYLWASKPSFGLYCSKDNGLTWTKDTIYIVDNTTLGPIYKYSNSYLSMASNPMSVIQSFDDGITWKTINTPDYSLSMYVPNDSTIIVQNQGGFKLNKSKDDGQNYSQVLLVYPTMGGGDLWHIYNKYGNYYYVLVPGGGLWKTPNFEEFEPIFQFETFQQKLFIDHKGNIYIAGSVFINAEDELTFVLPNSP